MANVKGIEIGSEIYNIEDETARTNANSAISTATNADTKATTAQTTAETAQTTAETAQTTAETADEKIGNLADLETATKTDIVSAVNEVLLGGTETTLCSINESGNAQSFAELTALPLPQNTKKIIFYYSVVGDCGYSQKMELERNPRTNIGQLNLGLTATVISEDGSYTSIVCREIDWNYNSGTVIIMPCSQITFDGTNFSQSEANQYLVPRKIVAIS